jgi:MFS family permease
MKKRLKKVAASHPIVQRKIDRSLSLSVREGAAASVSTAFGTSYFSAFALALNATAAQVGILHAIVNLLPSLAQMRTASLIRESSRKAVVLRMIFWRIVLWGFIIGSGVLFYYGVWWMSWAFILFAGVAYSLTAVANPLWFSWMGSLVPEARRGKYFSRRNRVIGIFNVVTLICGAVILDFSKSLGAVYGDVLGFTLLGFGILFFVAGVARTVSWFMLRAQYEPRIRVRKRDYFSFGNFLREARRTPFGKFCILRFMLNFVVGVASPFYVVYMLEYLDFSYVWYIGVSVSAVVFQVVFLPLLGKVSDRFGNVSLMRISMWGIAGTTLAWTFSGLIPVEFLKFYLLFVPGIFSGFGWAGHNLAVNNYVYDALRSKKRSFGLSYMNLFAGVGTFLGAVVGTVLAWVDVSFGNPMIFIFAVSAVGRVLLAFFGKRMLVEVRSVKRFYVRFLVDEFGPAHTLVKEIHHVEDILTGEAEHYVSADDRRRFEVEKLEDEVKRIKEREVA